MQRGTDMISDPDKTTPINAKSNQKDNSKMTKIEYQNASPKKNSTTIRDPNTSHPEFGESSS